MSGWHDMSLRQWPLSALCEQICASQDPLTLEVFTGPHDGRMELVKDRIHRAVDARRKDGSDEAMDLILEAYDLVHSLSVYGRAF